MSDLHALIRGEDFPRCGVSQACLGHRRSCLMPSALSVLRIGLALNCNKMSKELHQRNPKGSAKRERQNCCHNWEPPDVGLAPAGVWRVPPIPHCNWRTLVCPRDASCLSQRDGSCLSRTPSRPKCLCLLVFLARRASLLVFFSEFSVRCLLSPVGPPLKNCVTHKPRIKLY